MEIATTLYFRRCFHYTSMEGVSPVESEKFSLHLFWLMLLQNLVCYRGFFISIFVWAHQQA